MANLHVDGRPQSAINNALPAPIIPSTTALEQGWNFDGLQNRNKSAAAPAVHQASPVLGSDQMQPNAEGGVTAEPCHIGSPVSNPMRGKERVVQSIHQRIPSSTEETDSNQANFMHKISSPSVQTDATQPPRSSLFGGPGDATTCLDSPVTDGKTTGVISGTHPHAVVPDIRPELTENFGEEDGRCPTQAPETNQDSVARPMQAGTNLPTSDHGTYGQPPSARFPMEQGSVRPSVETTFHQSPGHEPQLDNGDGKGDTLMGLGNTSEREDEIANGADLESDADDLEKDSESSYHARDSESSFDEGPRRDGLRPARNDIHQFSKSWLDNDQSGNYNPDEERRRIHQESHRSSRRRKHKHRSRAKHRRSDSVVVDGNDNDDGGSTDVPRGCKRCRDCGLECSMTGRSSSWPCENCRTDEETCELITQPIRKRHCEKCNELGIDCSYQANPDALGKCQQCETDGYHCVAGPHKDGGWPAPPPPPPPPSRPKQVVSREHLFQHPLPTLSSGGTSCSGCVSHNRRCSLVGQPDKQPPCIQCEINGRICRPASSSQVLANLPKRQHKKSASKQLVMSAQPDVPGSGTTHGILKHKIRSTKMSGKNKFLRRSSEAIKKQFPVGRARAISEVPRPRVRSTPDDRGTRSPSWLMSGALPVKEESSATPTSRTSSRKRTLDETSAPTNTLGMRRNLLTAKKDNRPSISKKRKLARPSLDDASNGQAVAGAAVHGAAVEDPPPAARHAQYKSITADLNLNGPRPNPGCTFCANAAAAIERPSDTKTDLTLCAECTLDRVRIITCHIHDLSEVYVDHPSPSFNAIAGSLIGQPPDKNHNLCSLCRAKATVHCQAPNHFAGFDSGCGLKLCQSCEMVMMDRYEGEFGTMLRGMTEGKDCDRVGGLRADLELLLPGGPLDQMRFMKLR